MFIYMSKVENRIAADYCVYEKSSFCFVLSLVIKTLVIEVN
jgi:hypothetical protein